MAFGCMYLKCWNVSCTRKAFSPYYVNLTANDGFGCFQPWAVEDLMHSDFNVDSLNAMLHSLSHWCLLSFGIILEQATELPFQRTNGQCAFHSIIFSTDQFSLKLTWNNTVWSGCAIPRLIWSFKSLGGRRKLQWISKTIGWKYLVGRLYLLEG